MLLFKKYFYLPKAFTEKRLTNPVVNTSDKTTFLKPHMPMLRLRFRLVGLRRTVERFVTRIAQESFKKPK